ncbi:MAG: ATP synthase F0 subunit B [Acidobacteriota bacterium]|jgi:F-type H+-transporting ATPase subunit b
MNLIPDASLLVIMGIFWITYLILRVFLFGPVQEILRERRETIDSARAEHEAAMAKTDTKIEAERGRLNEARVEAASRRDALRREAEQERQRILAETREATDQRLAEAQEELDETVAREREGLEDRAGVLAGRMAEKLLEKSA